MIAEEKFQTVIGQFLKRYGKVSTMKNNTKDENARMLPFTVENQVQRFAVFAYKWKKSIGSDVLIRLEHKVSEMEERYDGAIVIGNKFSINAQDMVEDMNKRGIKRIILVKLSEIDQIMAKSGS